MKKTQKRRSRKKIVDEEQFDVTVKDSTFGSKTPEKVITVDAKDAETAMKTATQGGDANGSEEISVKKKAAGGVSGGSGGVYSMGESKMPMKRIVEAANYPYSVSLPSQFEKFLTESEIPFSRVGNTAMIRLETKQSLTTLLRKLNKSDDPLSSVVYSGISRSMS